MTTVPWFQGSYGPGGNRRLSRAASHEPFTPRLPGVAHDRPLLLAALLASAGIAGSWFIVTNMSEWPAWAIFPAIAGSVLAIAATVVGFGLLVVLALQPIIGSKDLNWGADPIAVLGLPVALQQKCEALGFWTCESMQASIANKRFPWTSLEYDERMQVERALARWNAVNNEHP